MAARENYKLDNAVIKFEISRVNMNQDKIVINNERLKYITKVRISKILS